MLQEALRAAGEGILLEVLERDVARALGRPVSRKSLEGLLVRNPERFEVDAGGRWRLRARVEEVEAEDPGPPPGRQPLERGRFVIFDLETLGREAAGEELRSSRLPWLVTRTANGWRPGRPSFGLELLSLPSSPNSPRSAMRMWLTPLVRRKRSRSSSLGCMVSP